MSLREFQTALGRMVRNTDGGGPLDSVLLDANEWECLHALQPSAALQFTRAVQRSWCEQRAANAAALTLSILTDATRRRILDEWINLGGGTLSFFGAEADALLDFIAGQLPDPSTELNICRLEQATLRASIHASCFQPLDPALFDPQKALRRGRHAGLVTALLIAPGLELLHRVAAPLEQLLWERLSVPATAAVLLQEGYPRDPIATMLQIGALEQA
ncbi:MAG: hypothetical protein QOI59_6141 [Gammaproteobacteria bacterium]|jgi:hypothetical protein|nr:hypothetical protein [Gammaproteobacteria bacterium]